MSELKTLATAVSLAQAQSGMWRMGKVGVICCH